MTNVLVLGGSGILGSMVVDVLARAPELTVAATVRNTALADRFRTLYPNVRWALFDGRNLDRDRAVFDRQAWIVNAMGITKPLIHDDHPAEIETAIAINSILPHRVGQCAADRGATVLQIATDCVYSGTKGGYMETDAHDALDAYGKTKSLGETYIPSVHHLRCSIIGPEPKDFKFLVEWFLRQPRGARVSGFVNHRWNGVTTLQFARLCLGDPPSERTASPATPGSIRLRDQGGDAARVRPRLRPGRHRHRRRGGQNSGRPHPVDARCFAECRAVESRGLLAAAHRR